MHPCDPGCDPQIWHFAKIKVTYLIADSAQQRLNDLGGSSGQLILAT